MSEIITFPLPTGPNYTIPDVGDVNWGQEVTNFLVAIPNGVMPTAGTFSLTGDVSFGTSFGIVSKYFKSGSANISATGVVRLAHSDSIVFRNFANSGDLPLAVDNSNNLTFNGSTFGTSGAVNPGLANQLAYYATSTNAVSGLTLITASRLLVSDSNGLPIALSAITAARLLSSDINGFPVALPAITAFRALVSNTNGFPIASVTTDTELSYVNGVTSSIQSQINSVVTTANGALQRSGGTMTGAIDMGSNKITSLSNGTSASDAMAFGQNHVFQVVSATSTTPFSTSLATFQTTNLSATITPTSTNSKILILVMGVFNLTTVAAQATISKNGTNILATNGGALFTVANQEACASLSYLDSPVSISALTYAVQLRTTSAATSVSFGDTGFTQSIILIEVQ